MSSDNNNDPDQRRKILDAETLASRWLADGNALLENGKKARAEKAFDKAQFWLDRANRGSLTKR